MNTPPAGPSIVLSPTEPLHSKDSDSRFPFAAAYVGFVVISLILLGLPALALRLSTMHATWLYWIIQFGVLLPILFFIFRWTINNHILGNVAQVPDALFEYEKRLSFKNPFLAGFIAYLALNMLILTVVDPIQKTVTQGSMAANIILDMLVSTVTGYFAFRLAVKHVVLKPYSAKRLWPMLGLIFALSISTTFAISLAEVRQEWTFRNHVYCEVLRPGMTQAEVTAALSEYGLIGQVNWEHDFEGPGAEDVTTFTTPYFDDHELEYRLRLVLGYDAKGTLMMVGREDYASFGEVYAPSNCPLPFLQ